MHQVSLESSHDVLDSLSNLAELWIAAMTTDTTLQDSLNALLTAVFADGDSLSNLLEQADSIFYLSVQDSVGALLTWNATLDEDSLYTWYEKRYNEIALNWLAGTEPDATAATDLRTIAQACLPDGGRAVLDARGLCAVWLKEYFNEGNCNLEGRSSEEANKMVTGTAPDLRIVPNPADEMVWISLQSNSAEGHQVQVFSMDGRQVFSGKMPSVGSMAIPVKGWQAGLYIAKITGDGTAITRRFMVQHP